MTQYVNKNISVGKIFCAETQKGGEMTLLGKYADPLDVDSGYHLKRLCHLLILRVLISLFQRKLILTNNQ